MNIEFEEPPARFVVSPNTPVRQVWVSALLKSYKLEWNEARGAFTLPGTDETLSALMARVISLHLGREVTL